MTISKAWQLARESARLYQEVIVPYLLGPYAEALVNWAQIQAGESVVDVGCGTGAATRAAARDAGANGSVTGVDLNEYMLDVARQMPMQAGSAPVDFVTDNALALALPSESTDIVVSSQMLQFLPDRVAGLREMRRILKPGGRVAIGVFNGPDENPYFKVQGAVIRKHLGDDASGGLRAGFTLRDPDEVRALLVEAGFKDVEVVRHVMPLSVPDPRTFVLRHLLATPVAPALEAASLETRAALVADAVEALAPYMQEEKDSIVIRLPFSSNFARGIR